MSRASDRQRRPVRVLETQVIAAAFSYKRARLAGDAAYVVEESGEKQPERSSDSWYEEAGKHERALFEALEALEALEAWKSGGAA